MAKQNNKKTVSDNKNDVDILRLEQETSDQFGHTIKFFLEKNKSGYVKIDFCNLDELESILYKFKNNSLVLEEY